MSPCKCSDPYALLNLLYGLERGQTAGEALRKMLPGAPTRAGAPLDESNIALSSPPQTGLKPGEILIHDVDLLAGPPGQPAPDYHDPKALLTVTQALLDKVQTGARLLRLQGISRVWGEPPHQAQNVLILGFLRAAMLIADPNVLVVAELETPLEVRAPYFGNGENAAHLIETGELPWLLLDAFARGESDTLQAWINSLRLPITDITFLHRLVWPDSLSVPLAAELLSEESLANLLDSLATKETQPQTFLAALDAAGEVLPPEMAQRRALAAHAILLTLAGLPALETASHTLPGLAAVLRAHAASPAFSPWGAQMGITCGDTCLGLMRFAPNGAMALCITNLSPEPQTAALDAAAQGFNGKWQDLLTGNVIDLDGEEWCRLEGYQSRWWAQVNNHI
jgi:hypothetical protein